MLLRLACSPADWIRVTAALEAADAHILAGAVRALLAVAPPAAGTEAVALDVTPEQAGALQRAAAGLGLNLPATPVAESSMGAGWAASAAERAEAVAAAEAVVRAHQRRRVA